MSITSTLSTMLISSICAAQSISPQYVLSNQADSGTPSQILIDPSLPSTIAGFNAIGNFDALASGTVLIKGNLDNPVGARFSLEGTTVVAKGSPNPTLRIFSVPSGDPGDFLSAELANFSFAINGLTSPVQFDGGFDMRDAEIEVLTGQIVVAGRYLGESYTRTTQLAGEILDLDPSSIGAFEIITEPTANNDVLSLVLSSQSSFTFDAISESDSQFPILPLIVAVGSGPLACTEADLAIPLGVLDLADINAFVFSFTTLDSAADLNEDGVYDLADLSRFVTSFQSGCL